MKNKIITGIALCSLFITGCSLDKAYLNGPNASTFPATKSEVEAGVFATYKGLTLIDASSTPFPRHSGQCFRHRRIAYQRRQLQLPAAVETPAFERMGD